MNTKTFHPRSTFLRVAALVLTLALTFGAAGPAFADAPANDDFDSAVEIFAPANVTMDAVSFPDSTQNLDDPNLPACSGGAPYNNPGEDTIWYTYIPLTYGEVTVDTYGSLFDTIIAVWTGTRTNLTSVVCNDDTIAGTGLESQVKFFASPGTTYYIEVVQFTSAGGGAPEKEFAPTGESFPAPLATDYMTLNLSIAPYATSAKYDSLPPATPFVFSSGWTKTTQSKAYKGSYQQASTANASATVKFYGKQFKLFYSRASNFGNLQIIIDGGVPIPPVTISQKKSTSIHQQVYTSPILGGGLDGYHTVQFLRLSATVNVDAIEILATPDTVAPGAITNLSAVAGLANGVVNLSWTATGDNGTSGVARSYEIRYSTAAITAANWSTTSVVSVVSGAPAPHAPGYVENFTVTNLPYGVTLNFAVRAVDDAYPAPLKTAVFNNAPAVVPYDGSIVTPGAPSTFYEENNPAWLLSGIWTNVPTAANKAHGNAYFYNSTIGNSAIIVFTGTKFILYYFVGGSGSGYGKLSVYVDGVSKATLNQLSSSAIYQVKYTYPATGSLPLGTHMVKLVHLTGAKVSIDAIQIYP